MYASLSLVTDYDPEILPVDYNLSLQVVYINTASHFSGYTDEPQLAQRELTIFSITRFSFLGTRLEDSNLAPLIAKRHQAKDNRYLCTIA